MLRRILCTLFCLSALTTAVYALDAETRAPAEKKATIEKKRATNPKATTNAQRFKSTRVGQTPLNQRFEVHQGVFQAKKKRHKKAKIKKLRLQPKECLASGGFKKKTLLKARDARTPNHYQAQTCGPCRLYARSNRGSCRIKRNGSRRGGLSMAGLNEFQYREDHSTEAGIPVQVAGGEHES